MKKVILFFMTIFAFINCSALNIGNCDYSTISRMKSIVNNVNMVYDYYIVNDEIYYSVTLTNLTNDIYIYDVDKGKTYYYYNTNNGELTIYDYFDSGRYNFYSNNPSCTGTFLGSKYYTFPPYNEYYNDPLCSDIPEYSLCKKWVSVDYSREEFQQFVTQYKNKKEVDEEKITIEYEKTLVDKIVDIYINYYYYFLGGIIVLLTPIIIISNRKNRFKL